MRCRSQVLAVETSTYVFGRLNAPHNKGLPRSKKYRDSKDDDKSLTLEEPAYWVGAGATATKWHREGNFHSNAVGLVFLSPLYKWENWSSGG